MEHPKKNWDRFISIQKELRIALNEAEKGFEGGNLTTALKEIVKQVWSFIIRLGNGEMGYPTSWSTTGSSVMGNKKC